MENTTKLMGCIKIIRPHQWIKNGLILAPAFFAGHLFEIAQWPTLIGAFIAFSLVASSIYIFNDYRDCEADKHHAKKKTRPLPAGLITKPDALSLLGILLVLAAFMSYLTDLPQSFNAILLLYIGLNVAYSMGLKQVPILELFILASGYLLRLVAGSEIIIEPLSHWIIVATSLVALLIAAGKRRGDIAQANDGAVKRKSLEGYSKIYLDLVITMLAAATIVTYFLFCISDYAYLRFGPSCIWSAAFVIFGIMRYLQIVIVFQGGDAPTKLIYQDKPMMITAALFAIFFSLLIYI